MDRLTGKDAKHMMEALASVYVKEEVDQEVISEEVEELEENRGNRAAELRAAREAQAASGQPTRAQQQFGGVVDALKAKPRPAGSFRDRINARRSASPAAQANTNAQGQNVKTGPITGTQQKPAPQAVSKPAPAAAPKPAANPNVTAGGTKFERRLPTMAELRAAQAARAAGKGEEGAIKAAVNAGKPAVTGSAAGAKPAAPVGGAVGSAAGAAKPAGNAPNLPSAAVPKTRLDAALTGIKPGAGVPGAGVKPMAAAGAAPTGAAPAPRPRPTGARPMGARNRMRMEELDIFDTIKEYLIGEGATEEEALKQMLTLTDEQRTEILEGSCGSKPKKKGGYKK